MDNGQMFKPKGVGQLPIKDVGSRNRKAYRTDPRMVVERTRTNDVDSVLARIKDPSVERQIDASMQGQAMTLLILPIPF